jgi:hypothetical protein
MLIQRGGNPGMSKLQQGSTSGSKKQSRFAVYLPANRVRAKDARSTVVPLFVDGGDACFEVAR